jgi:hypothetical protein
MPLPVKGSLVQRAKSWDLRSLWVDLEWSPRLAAAARHAMIMGVCLLQLSLVLGLVLLPMFVAGAQAHDAKDPSRWRSCQHHAFRLGHIGCVLARWRARQSGGRCGCTRSPRLLESLKRNVRGCLGLQPKPSPPKPLGRSGWSQSQPRGSPAKGTLFRRIFGVF